MKICEMRAELRGSWDGWDEWPWYLRFTAVAGCTSFVLLPALLVALLVLMDWLWHVL